MPGWRGIVEEINSIGNPIDITRRKYLKALSEKTGRNVITYYSGWLQKVGLRGLELNDDDKNGFMSAIHEIDRSRGLDLVLHTPGGEVAATESLVDYLRAMFGTDIRAIVPQIAMSAGTMVACACKEILMGKPSSLGPIDPHFGGIPAHGVLEEFERAFKEIKGDSAKAAVWQPIIARYNPAFIGECEKAVAWSQQMTRDWLESGMFQGDDDRKEKAARVVEELADHSLTLSHSRHLSVDKCESLGLKISRLEDDQELQEVVLSLHHACIHTLSATEVCKIIENQAGASYLKAAQLNRK